MILSIRTDKPEAEVALWEQTSMKSQKKWQAHRELSDTLLTSIEEIMNKEQINWDDLEGIVIFKGPGSFTGLRIGITVANTIAYSNNLPIVGATGKDWAEKAVEQIIKGKNDKIVMPEYGGDANITKPKK